jgi:hypothetical protein
MMQGIICSEQILLCRDILTQFQSDRKVEIPFCTTGFNLKAVCWHGEPPDLVVLFVSKMYASGLL